MTLSSQPPQGNLFIGLMSGTSLDGVDGVLAAFPTNYASGPIHTLATAYLPFSGALSADLMALQTAADNEIQREALAANALVQQYDKCVSELLRQSGISYDLVCAIGAHGQTIRHQPDLGYTRQTNNPALLAELTSIDVIADFRSRDVAAGGQGAPLVPAFHQAVFSAADEARVVLNIGGISNLSILPNRKNQGNEPPIIGFDTGPGNVLMDAWIMQHYGKSYDENGDWAASGKIIPALLDTLREERFFVMAPPKSTGRDLFNSAWLANKLAAFGTSTPVDVQATLAAFTATTIADAIITHAADAQAVYVCGGGALNAHLMQQLTQALHARQHAATVQSTLSLGVPPNHVEALAFAWLAHRFHCRRPGNLPSVSGAAGPRILGALYPAGNGCI